MTALAKLLPCPFCGRSNLIISRMHGTGDRYVVCQTPECKTCGPSGDAREDAISAWNRRASLSPAELGGVELQRWSVIADGTSGVEEFKNVSGRWVKYSDVSFTPRAAEAVTEEVERVMQHIGNALTYIEKTYPGTKYLDADPVLRNMRRWHDKLRSALTPPSAKGENGNV